MTFPTNEQNFFLLYLNSSTLFPHLRGQSTENTGMKVCAYCKNVQYTTQVDGHRFAKASVTFDR